MEPMRISVLFWELRSHCVWFKKISVFTCTHLKSGTVFVPGFLNIPYNILPHFLRPLSKVTLMFNVAIIFSTRCIVCVCVCVLYIQMLFYLWYLVFSLCSLLHLPSALSQIWPLGDLLFRIFILPYNTPLKNCQLICQVHTHHNIKVPISLKPNMY